MAEVKLTLAAGDGISLTEGASSLTVAADVVSVNGETGEVSLSAADVGGVADDDARLTDARTPTAHASTHAPGGSDPLAAGISFQWTTDNEVTTDQTPATSDMGERYIFMPATAATKTVTLPSMGASEDGKWIAITNAGPYMVYVTAADTDYIGWPAIKVLSIECLPNSHIVLRYDHSRTRWDIVYKTGSGQVRPKSSELYMECDVLLQYQATSASSPLALDSFQNHMPQCAYEPYVAAGAQKFGAACYYFDGSNDWIQAPSSTVWSLFSSLTTDQTLSVWVKFGNAAGSEEHIIACREDANNYWVLYRTTGGSLGLKYVSGSSTQIDISGGTISGTSAYYHLAICVVQGVVGLYVDQSQVAYDNSWSVDTFSANMHLAQSGAGTYFCECLIDDLALVHANILGAAPNATPNDTIIVPTNSKLGLVI